MNRLEENGVLREMPGELLEESVLVVRTEAAGAKSLQKRSPWCINPLEEKSLALYADRREATRRKAARKKAARREKLLEDIGAPWSNTY